MSRLDPVLGIWPSVVIEDAKRHLNEPPLEKIIFKDGVYNPNWPSVIEQGRTLTFWWFQQSAEEQRKLLKKIFLCEKQQILLTTKILRTPASEAYHEEVIFQAALLFLLYRPLNLDNFYTELENFIWTKNVNMMIRANQISDFLKNTCEGKPTSSVNNVERGFLLHLLSLIANASLENPKTYSLFEIRNDDRIYLAASKLILEIDRRDCIMHLLTYNPTLTAWVLKRFEKSKSEISPQTIFGAMRLIYKADNPRTIKSVQRMLALCLQFLGKPLREELKPYQAELLIMQKYAERFLFEKSLENPPRFSLNKTGESNKTGHYKLTNIKSKL